MLKSFLIKLRRKPKLVRDHAAMVIAGVFTFVVFGIWAFSIPEQFSNFSDNNPSEIISTLKNDIKADAPDVSKIKENFSELTASTSDETDITVIPNKFPVSTSTNEAISNSNERPIRIATTTPSTSVNSQNSQ